MSAFDWLLRRTKPEAEPLVRPAPVADAPGSPEPKPEPPPPPADPYGTDFLPEQIKELAAAHENFEAVKESSTDVRRITWIRELVGDRLAIFVGVDDAIVEGIAVGAVGWIAGLVNALPKESVEIFNYAMNGEREKAIRLYNWFLPLLRMDTVPKFVQLIKLVQQEVGMGNARVRPPRLELNGSELEDALTVIRHALSGKS